MNFTCPSPPWANCSSAWSVPRNDPRAREPLEKLLRDAVLISPDDQTAEHYAKLRAHLTAKGTPIPENDIWIAATARRHQLKLYHDDAHFELLEDLIDGLRA